MISSASNVAFRIDEGEPARANTGVIDGKMDGSEPANIRRIELILRQIDSLPTLPSVATRLLSLTADDESNTQEVVDLISSDQALTLKVLALCRTADNGVSTEVMTVERAVLLLGFMSVRNAVLSVKVIDQYQNNHSDTSEAESGFDHTNYWRHCIAVAIAAELIADAHPDRPDLPAGEAFVCGLLHDIGKVAMNQVLPKSYTRVVELSNLNQANIAEFERRIVGMDHHTAGKRLAEQWQLPHRLQDSIWLHGTAFGLLPPLDHRPLIGLLSLADLVVRRHHIGYSGNHEMGEDPDRLAAQMDLDPQVPTSIVPKLYEELERRSRALGLDDQPSQRTYLESIQRANTALTRLNSVLERRSRAAARQGRVLDVITSFHTESRPGSSVEDVLGHVVRSAENLLGPGYFAMVYAVAGSGGQRPSWLLGQYGPDGRQYKMDLIDNVPASADLEAFENAGGLSMDLMSLLPWLADHLEVNDHRRVRLMSLRCGWKTVALLLYDHPHLTSWSHLQALTHSWASAIAASAQHDGARRLGEQLAQSNRELAQTQQNLVASESLVRLGEMAGGAAHEMNNPLAVISGRSQLLAANLSPGSEDQKSAQTIVEHAQKLSDLITSLRMFAEPPRANPRITSMTDLLNNTVDRVRRDLGHGEEEQLSFFVKVQSNMPDVVIDPEQIGLVLTELLNNAVLAKPKQSIQLSAMTMSVEKKLVLCVIDDGMGMDSDTFARAFEPFFSSKKSGRRMGMGLARTQQLVAGHGGEIRLQSGVGQGTTATVTLPLIMDIVEADRAYS